MDDVLSLLQKQMKIKSSLLEFKSKLSMLLDNTTFFLLLAFLIPLMVRIIPEVLMGPFVVGFDTLGYYVPNTLLWLRNGVDFWNFFAVAPLFYMLLMGITSVGVPIILSLKVMSPLLLGFLGLAVYCYATKALSWSPRKSLLGVLFTTLYFVALRVSWDMLRTELGLIFLFTTLTLMKKSGLSFRNGLLLSISMLFVVFSHPLVAVVMFSIVLVTTIRLHFDGNSFDAKALVFSSVPAVLLFLVMIFANYFVSSTFSLLSAFPALESEGFMALFGFDSYQSFVLNTLGFLVFCYLPLLPLVFLGFRRLGNNLQIKVWIICVFFALLSSIISPNAFVHALPYRWVLLLVYPLAFYAVEAFHNLKLNLFKVSAGVLLSTLTLCFMVLPSTIAFPYYSMFPLYVPTSMLQNTVPVSDCQDTINALQWVADNLDGNSCLLAGDAFYSWSIMNVDANQVIPISYDDPERMAQETLLDGSHEQIYLIWWTNGNGWHGQTTVSSVFKEIYVSGKVAVYCYN